MPLLFPITRLALAFILALASGAAWAQRTAENATVQSNDAFGRQIGSERTGLYGQDEVRGFNPVDAGNVRIEGLYFDQIDRLSQRLTEGSAIRVGITAQRFQFPAPTGIVDISLTKPGGEAEGSFNFELGPFNSPGGSLEIKLPIDGRRLALSLGVGGRNFEQVEGGSNRFRNFGAALVWRPYHDAEIMAFGGMIFGRDNEARPTFYPAGAFLPPKVVRRLDLSQPWADRSQDNANAGLIVHLPLGSGWRMDGGLFRSHRDTYTNFADLLTGVTQDGNVARRTIIADGNYVDQSISGELRLVKEWTSAAFAHRLTASLRARHKQRTFGGSVRLDLGPSTVLAPDVRTLPTYSLRPHNDDDVRQTTYGLAYSLLWNGKVNVDLSLSKTRYRKRVDFANPALADIVTRDRPLLWNADASVVITHRLSAYAGMTRGMEEALIAPENATNASEAPPAIRTRQEEAGFKFAVTPSLSLIAGVFHIAKPYYNLDPAARYRNLGTIAVKGAEISLTGRLVPGLTLVAGTVLMNPRLSGEAVTSRQIGERPVGQVRRRSIANIDWRPKGGKSAWSFDLAYDGVSSRYANAANSLVAPPRSNVNIGARYRFKVNDIKFLIRPRIENLFNSYGWNVSANGGFTYTSSRTATLELITDF